MKLFITVLAILILGLTIIDKLRIRFGYKGTRSMLSERWMVVLIAVSILLIGFAGHQYYTTRETGALSKLLLPVVLLVVLIDQWRRRSFK